MIGISSGFGIDEHLGRSGERSLSLDDAGTDDARTDVLAGLDAVDQRFQRVDLVGHVAHRGHARGEIEQTVGAAAKMHMHVPQARHQQTAAAVELLDAIERSHIGRADGDDAARIDQHRAGIDDLATGRIEHAHVADQQR